MSTQRLVRLTLSCTHFFTGVLTGRSDEWWFAIIAFSPDGTSGESLGCSVLAGYRSA